MPVEFVRDASGRRTRSGNLSSAPALVPDAAPKAGKVIPAKKPTLWSMVGNAAAYEAKRLTHDPLKRLTELGASAIHRPVNDVKYELGQLSNPKTAVPRLINYGLNAIPGMASANSRDSQQAITTIAANTARNAIEAWQSAGGNKSPDYSTTGFGQFADFAEKSQYNRFGDKPPIEQEGLQRLTTDVRNDIFLALGLAAGGEVIAGGLAGVPLLGRVAAGAGNVLNPLKAKTAIGGVARLAAGGAVEEALAVPFQDNSGSAAGLVDLVLGTSIDPVKPGMNRVQQMQAAVGPNALAGALVPAMLGGAFHGIMRSRRAANGVAGQVDARSAIEGMGFTETHPETDAVRFTDGAQQEPPPATYAEAEAAYRAKNGLDPVAPAAAPSAPMAPGGAVLNPEAQLPQGDPSVNPWGEPRPNDPWTGRPGVDGAVLDPGAGLPEADPRVRPWEQPDPNSPVQQSFLSQQLASSPENARYQEWLQSNETQAGVPSAQMQPGGAVNQPAAKLPEADPNADPWDVYYDESLPEADVVLHQLRQMDPEELKALDQSPEVPVTQGIENALLSRPQTEVDSNRTWAMTSMPRANVSEDFLEKRYATRVGKLDFSELRDLAFNSPQVADRLAEITGKGLDEASKTDLVKAVLSMDDVLLTNRMKGDSMAPINDLVVAPEEMQYKSNVNAIGEQAGNPLEGVTKWDPDAEGVVSVYPDSDAGVEKIGNGHHRYALAKRLGVPSLLVKRLDAASVPDARFQAAVENISAGAGTVWDAAKFVRESGITDLKQLKASGKSITKGLWKNGFSLSQLPDDLFLAAQNGVVDEGYAALIGGSGLPPEKMTSLFQEISNRPPTDAGEMTNLILAAKSAPTGSADQVDLFGNALVDLTREKARLARDIQKNLASDKNVFAGIKRNAGAIEGKTSSSIDTAGAAGVADQAKVAKRYFDSVWYQSGPVSDMLDRGASDIANGMSRTAVVDRIKQQLPALLEQEMGKAGPVAVDQVGLLDEVAPAPEPTPPPEPSLDELHGRLLQRAIAKGEVRPPETIIPDIPVDNGVNLQKALEEAARGEEGPNLQAAIAEEARLREEFRVRDEAVQQAALQARRDAEGYDLKTFEERKSEVMAGIEEPPVRLPAPPQTGLTDRQIRTYSGMTPKGLAAEKAIANKYLLGDRALQSKLAKKAEFDANAAKVAEYLDESPGSNSPKEMTEEAFMAKYGPEDTHPQLQKKSAENAVNTALSRHQFAVDFNAWYDSRGATTPIGKPPAEALLKPGSLLFHGTTEAGLKGIMANGFRVSNAESAGTVLGEGVYFASNERYGYAYGGKMTWGELPSDAKILDLRAQDKTVGDLAKKAGVTGELKTHLGDVRLTYEQQQQVKDWALANGYDGIRYRSFDTPDEPELETVIYNVDLANRLVGSNAAPAPIGKPPGVSSREYLKDLTVRSLPEIASAVTPETLPRIRAAETPDLIRWAKDVEPGLVASHPELTRVVQEEVANRYAGVDKRMQDWEDDMKRGLC